MKGLVVGDPHSKVSNTHEIDMLGDAIVAEAKRLRADAIFLLGDLSDSFEKVHILAMYAICCFFRKLQALDIPIYVLVGNHDMLNNRVFLEEFHALAPFKQWKGITIVDKVIVGRNFTLVPYVAPGRFLEALNTAGDGWKKSKAIFCHQEFRDAPLGAVLSKVGDVWPAENPLVISGHIHDECWLAPNIRYVGEPADSSYGGKGNRTISLFEFLDNGTFVETLIDLKLPRKITLTLGVEDAKVLTMPENTSVRLNLVGTSEELTAFKKTKEYAALKAKVKIVPKVLNPASEKKGYGRATYLDLLARSCVGESPLVQQAFDELTQSENNALQT